MDSATIDRHISQMEDALAGLAVVSRGQHAAYEDLPSFKIIGRDYDVWLQRLAAVKRDWGDTDLSRVVSSATALRDYAERRRRIVCDVKATLVGAGATGASLQAIQSQVNAECSAYALAFSLWEHVKRTAEQRAKEQELQTV